MKDLSIVIPAYNEGRIIEQSIKTVHTFFSTQPLMWELVVVNDGSTDGTREQLDQLQKKYERLTVIHFPHNRGKGAAVREGFRQSVGDYMLFFDADLSVPLEEFRKFWDAKNECMVLIGSRVLHDSQVMVHQPMIKEYTGKLGNLLTRILLPLPYHDTQCGFKLFPGSFRSMLSKSSINGALFDVEWLMLARAHDFTIQEIPVIWSNRSESRFTLLSYIRSLYDLIILSLRYRHIFSR